MKQVPRHWVTRGEAARAMSGDGGERGDSNSRPGGGASSSKKSRSRGDGTDGQATTGSFACCSQRASRAKGAGELKFRPTSGGRQWSSVGSSRGDDRGREGVVVSG